LSARKEIGQQNVHMVINTGCSSVGLPALEQLGKEHPSDTESFRLSSALDPTARGRDRGAQVKQLKRNKKYKAIPHSGSKTVSPERGGGTPGSKKSI